MPKNSRRKKDARSRAVGKGERYTRALRQTSHSEGSARTTAEPSLEVELDTWEADLERIWAVQRFVESRGWVVGPYVLDGVDEHGRAISGEVSWDYAPAFGGVSFDPQDPGDETEDYPLQPEVAFTWDPATDGMSVVVQTAGNAGGCEQHRTGRHVLLVTEHSAPGLRELLEVIEESARSMDPAPLLDCTAQGPCGGHARERAERREQGLAWFHAMGEAFDNMSQQKRAELQAWEDEHLGTGDLGTGDWPGWEPLIGARP